MGILRKDVIHEAISLHQRVCLHLSIFKCYKSDRNIVTNFVHKEEMAKKLCNRFSKLLSSALYINTTYSSHFGRHNHLSTTRTKLSTLANINWSPY